MAAPKKPLEFHAKRPWGPEEGGEDPDEDDEDDNEGAENGFSLEEVLRLGGTKVMALDSRRRGTEARGVVPLVAGQMAQTPPSCGVDGILDPDPGFEMCSVRFPRFLFSTTLYKRKVV